MGLAVQPEESERQLTSIETELEKKLCTRDARTETDMLL
jgi:hypothetical protein